MNYIYDILLNFRSTLFDFYEWNDADDITHIRKMPAFKINTSTLNEIKQYTGEMENSFLQRIKNKTEMFQKKTVKQIEYACLFTDGNEGIAVLFQKGKPSLYSHLLLDEEEDLLDMSDSMEEVSFAFQKIKKIDKNPFQTRKEKEMEFYIKKELGKISGPELEYLYFECFNERVKDEDIKEKIKERLQFDFTKTSRQIYDFFKLLGAKK